MCTSCHWAIALDLHQGMGGHGMAWVGCQPFGLRVIASSLLEIWLNLQEPLVRKAPPISIGQARSPWHWGPVCWCHVWCVRTPWDGYVKRPGSLSVHLVFPLSECPGDLHSQARKPFCMMRSYVLHLYNDVLSFMLNIAIFLVCWWVLECFWCWLAFSLARPGTM